MRRIADIFFDILFWPFILIFKFLPRISYYYFRKILTSYGNKNNSYIIYREWPKYKYDNYTCDLYKKNEKACILIQGPPVYKDNFTYETIRIYKQICGYKVYYSTWNDIPDEYVKKIESLGAIVILNDKPNVSGFLNINYQSISSLNGLKRIEKDGFELCLKTRSDQRIYKLEFMTFFDSLLKTFGDNKVVCVNYNFNALCWSYYISDFLYYGKIENLKSIFDLDDNFENFSERVNCSWSTKECYNYLDKLNPSRVECSKQNLAPEIIYIKNYLHKKGFEISYDKNTNFKILKDFFITISQEDIGLYWTKYSYTNVCMNELDGLYNKSDNSKLKKSFNQTTTNWIINFNDMIDVSKIIENDFSNKEYWRK